MRGLVGALSLFLFIAIFIHGLFLVTGIAPNTTEYIHASIRNAASLGFAQLQGEAVPQEEQVFVQKEYVIDSNMPRITAEPPRVEQRPKAFYWDVEKYTKRAASSSGYIALPSQERITEQYESIHASENQPRGPELSPDSFDIDSFTAEPQSVSYQAGSAEGFDYGDYPYPVRVTIASIDVDASIVVPPNTELATLDSALEGGVVYYPESARFGQKGNTFLFGHSSWLPVVRNRNFAIFNDLGKLKDGDLVIVHAEGKKYVYEVFNNYIADREEVWVDFGNKDQSILTLSTCDSFGAKHDRVVVEARLVGA